MKKIILPVLLICFLFAGYLAPVSADKIGIIAEESDGDPSDYAYKVKFPNGSLSVTGGVATYGGGGSSVPSISFLDSAYDSDSTFTVGYCADDEPCIDTDGDALVIKDPFTLYGGTLYFTAYSGTGAYIQGHGTG